MHTTEDGSIMDYLQFSFPAGYKDPVPTPAIENHPLATSHPSDLVVYITTEVREGTMVHSMNSHSHWCQVNVLLTRPKKNSDT